MQRLSLFGVPVDSVTKEEMLGKLFVWLEEKRGTFHHLVTPGPEFIVEAQKNKEFLQVLEQADLSLADGIGLVIALRWLRHRSLVRMTGADIVKQLLDVAEKRGKRVCVLSWNEGLSSAKDIFLAVRKQYSGIHLLVLETERQNVLSQTLLRKICAFKPAILLVSLGSPEQDLLIAKAKITFSTSGVRIAMGVGSSLDYITGAQKRAPLFMQNIGLEWLWRLCLQPRRARRIFHAIIIFPWLLLRARLKA